MTSCVHAAMPDDALDVSKNECESWWQAELCELECGMESRN